MSLRLVWTVARWEFRLISRGPAFWLAALAAAAFNGSVVWRAADPASAGFALAQQGTMLIPLCFLLALSGVRRRDEALAVSELIHSRPVPGTTYLAGKFAAGWAAMATAWLVSLAVCVGIAVIQHPRQLMHWLPVLALSTGLVLPGYAFVTALCLTLDVAFGRFGPVPAVSAAVIFGSFIPVREVWAAYLSPLLLPHWGTSVFGLDPYSGLLAANKGWALAIAAALVGFSIWLFPRRTPALGLAADRPVVIGLLGAAAAGGFAAIAYMAPMPPLAELRTAAQGWELAMVGAAVGGGPAAPAYWQPHAVAVGPWTTVAWLADEQAALAAPLAAAAAQVLPYFPDLQPEPGEPFHIVQGGYAMEPRWAGGALVLPAWDVRRVQAGHGPRTLLRAMAQAQWSRRSGAPLPWRHPDYGWQEGGVTSTWGAVPAQVEQWCVWEQVAGPEAIGRELAAWRDESAPATENEAASNLLWDEGPIGNGVRFDHIRQALALWAVTRERGCDAVLSAFRAAAALPEVQNAPPTHLATEDQFWAAVSAELSLDVSRLPGWESPQPWPPPAPGHGG